MNSRSRTFDAAGRYFDVLFGERAFDVGRCQVVSRQARSIEPDAHRIASFAEDQQLRNAGQYLQAIFDDAIGIVRQLHFVVPIGIDRHVDDGRCIGFDFRDDGVVDFARQETACAGDAVAYVVRGSIGIAAAFEAHGNLRLFRAADRTDVVDALDSRNTVFERRRDLRFDDLRVGAEIIRRDRDDRIVDVRKFANRQPVPRNQSEHHDDQIRDGRKDRAADAQIRQNHVLLTVAAAAGGAAGAARATALSASTVLTAMPSRIFNWPGRYNEIAEFEAGADFDARVLAFADLNFGQRNVAVVDTKYEMLIALRHDRGLRHEQGLRVVVDDQRRHAKKVRVAVCCRGSAITRE